MKRSLVLLVGLTAGLVGAEVGAAPPGSTAPPAFAIEACPEGTTLDRRLLFLHCKDAEGRKHGPSLYRFNPEGNVTEAGVYDRGQKQGVWRIWHLGAAQMSGGLKEESTYRDGVLHGPSRQWFGVDFTQYPTPSVGVLALEARYHDGKHHGPQAEYYPSGEPKARANFVHGVMEGPEDGEGPERRVPAAEIGRAHV